MAARAHEGLFVYGTLTDSDIVRILLDRDPTTETATLTGYRRYGLRGRAYPGLVPESGASCTGTLITGLSEIEEFILDEYEDTDYYRKDVEVTTASGRTAVAVAYVWKEEGECEGEWTLEDFQARDKPPYVAMVHEFKKEIDEVVRKRLEGSGTEQDGGDDEGSVHRAQKSYLEKGAVQST
ncbi:unnamed protein product [Pedinophyceae sp. YPF-701]|nr:unnamed protein product [Pedinophyceae sp. YPF-701]